MTYDLGTPQFDYACPMPNCDRTLGPYFFKSNLLDAVGEHRKMQHANTLERMDTPDTSTRRFAVASSVHAGYEAPNAIRRTHR